MPFLHDVETHRVDDPAILSARMRKVDEPAAVDGRLDGRGRDFYVLDNTTEDKFAVFRFRLSDVQMLAAEASSTRESKARG